jgi:hypothetical protein
MHGLQDSSAKNSGMLPKYPPARAIKKDAFSGAFFM